MCWDWVCQIIIWAAYMLLKDAYGGKSIGKTILNLTLVVPGRKRVVGWAESINRNWPLLLPPLLPMIAVQILLGKRTRFGDVEGCVVIDDADWDRNE
jgi:hypothetical protein